MLKKIKTIIASGLANTFEWYDYALFGNFASVIADKFFPSADKNVAILNAYLVFAIGYLMRPLGGFVFGVIGDRFGRRTALSLSVICMSVPTVIIGILPTFETIGFSATVIMVIVRMLQGLSIGGALTGSISFIIEHTPAKKRGLTGSVSMAGICIGILLGSLMSSLLKSLLSYENFMDWGWRIPFLFGIIVMFLGVYIKLHTDETPDFQKAKKNHNLTISPIKIAFKEHKFNMLISILINSTGSVIFYLQAIYIGTYLKINRDFDLNIIDNLVNFSYFLMAITTLLSGWLSDVMGKKNIYFIILLCIAVFNSFVMFSFENGSLQQVVIAHIILAILAASYIGAEPALQAELYPINIRNTSLSISYNIAVSLFGGTAPYVLEYISQKAGSLNACSYYTYACVILSTIGIILYKPFTKKDL